MLIFFPPPQQKYDDSYGISSDLYLASIIGMKHRFTMTVQEHVR